MVSFFKTYFEKQPKMARAMIYTNILALTVFITGIFELISDGMGYRGFLKISILFISIIVSCLIRNVSERIQIHIYTILLAIIDLVAMMFSNEPISIIFIMPITGVFILFNDTKLLARATIYGVLVAVAFESRLVAMDILSLSGAFVGGIGFIIGIMICLFSSAYNNKVAEKRLVDANNQIGRISEQEKKINSLLLTLRNSVEVLTSSESSISSRLGNTAANISEAYDGVLKVTEAIQNQQTNVVDIQKSLTFSTGKADNSLENTKKQEGLSDELSKYIDELGKRSENLNNICLKNAKNSKELQNNAEGIYGIIDIIQDVAEEINLLSLNAQIEAARAGDQGRGFAVIAESIGKLSDQTQNSVQAISKQISSLVSALTLSVEDMDKCISEINEESHLIEKIIANDNEVVSINSVTGENINELTANIKQIEKNNLVVQDNINDLSALSEEIAASMDTVREDAQGCVDGMSKISEVITSINVLLNEN